MKPQTNLTLKCVQKWPVCQLSRSDCLRVVLMMSCQATGGDGGFLPKPAHFKDGGIKLSITTLRAFKFLLGKKKIRKSKMTMIVLCVYCQPASSGWKRSDVNSTD